MFKLVFIINGAGGVGKDTICGIVAKRYPTLNVSSIDPIKQIALLGGWDFGDKSPAARKLLSDIKRAFTEYNDLPTRYITEKFQTFRRDENRLLFVHIREPEEIEKFKRIVEAEQVPCFTLLVTSKRVSAPLGNASDDEVANYPYDLTYYNEKPEEELPEDFMAFFEENIVKREGFPYFRKDV